MTTTDPKPSDIDALIEDADECAFWSGPVPVRNHTSGLVDAARAELAALREKLADRWECERCAFACDAIHTQTVVDGPRTCPNCENVALREKLALADRLAEAADALGRDFEDMCDADTRVVYTAFMPALAAYLASTGGSAS